jgi:hypothetical protein
MGSAQKTQRVIQLELNEISPVLIKQLVSQGHLPNFKKVIASWHESETTSEDVYENIEPWIQWVSAHTGKTFGEHGVFRLGDVHELKDDQIWEKLSDRGLKCAIVGAMNAKPGRQKEGVFFPDPWSKSNTTVPADLRSLWDLVSSRVQAHASAQPSLADILKAVKSAGQFNISLRLMVRIAKQLVAQRVDPKVKWRLAGLFDLFLADIFCSVQKNQEYRFLTLFLNSIAVKILLRNCCT